MTRRPLSNAVPHRPSWSWAVLFLLVIAGIWANDAGRPGWPVILTSVFLLLPVAYEVRAAVWWAKHPEYAAAAARLTSVVRDIPAGPHLHVDGSCFQHTVTHFGPLRRRIDALIHTPAESRTQPPDSDPSHIVCVDVYTVISGVGRVCHQTVHHRVYVNGESETIERLRHRPGLWAGRSGVYDLSPEEMHDLAGRLEVGLANASTTT